MKNQPKINIELTEYWIKKFKSQVENLQTCEMEKQLKKVMLDSYTSVITELEEDLKIAKSTPKTEGNENPTGT